MASSTITGIGSGFDTQGIVKALVAAERAPKDSQILKQQTTATTQLSAVGTVKVALETYRAALTKLNTATSFSGLTGTSSEEKTAKVTIDDAASTGKYQLEVTQLATAAKVSSAVFAGGSSAKVNPSDSATTLTISQSGKDYNVSIPAGATMQEAREAINTQLESKGISANVLSDAKGARLVITSTDTGEGSDITLSGESELAKGFTTGDPPQNAKFKIDGFEMESKSNKITSAIYRLTSGEEHHAYYTTNHGEQTLTDTLTSALENQNLTLTGLDMLSDSIPEDCDLLIINNPVQDFASAGALVDEMSDLRGYLSRGGKLLITTDSYNRTPNLDALLAEFGLSRTEGLVVEGDSSHSMNGYPTYLLPDYASAVESGVLDNVDKNRGVLLQMAQGIALTETEDVISEALLTTSAESYSKTAGYEMTTLTQEDGDPDGPFTLAAYARNENTEAEVIWIDCGNMDNEGIYQVLPGNVTFLQACATTLAFEESTTLIESKALEAAPLEVSNSTSVALGLTFVIVLPAAVLAAGAVVVLLRRRK